MKGAVIENIIIGGPAFHSALIEKGDLVLGVDGNKISEESICSALIGDDVPGSSVVVTVQKRNHQVVVLFCF
jgi:S1-C subfamily serine protease